MSGFATDQELAGRRLDILHWRFCRGGVTSCFLYSGMPRISGYLPF
jgi:hypothetical protein